MNSSNSRPYEFLQNVRTMSDVPVPPPSLQPQLSQQSSQQPAMDVITMPIPPNVLTVAPVTQITPRTAEVNVAYVDFLENKLNTDIGWFYWKKYVAAAVWAQISMPMNLAITLMTALTTAQANAPNLLPEQIYKNLTYVTLILTVLNTFFRPHEKLQNNLKYMKEWGAIGIAFEKVYYSDINNSGARTAAQRISPAAAVTAPRLAAEYGKLQDAANALRQKEGPDMMNFFTDLIHLLCYYTCMRKYRRWLDKDDQEAIKAPTALPGAVAPRLEN